jgi:hypothetical protein
MMGAVTRRSISRPDEAYVTDARRCERYRDDDAQGERRALTLPGPGGVGSRWQGIGLD